MPYRKQDLAVLFFHYLGYSKVRQLSRQRHGRPWVRFVAFHDVPTATEQAFRLKLRYLKTRCNVVSLDDYFAGNLCLKRLNVVITFDDGYKGWLLRAVPMLKELRLPALFFVSSGFVGLSQRDELEFVRLNLETDRTTSGGLTREELRNIAEHGFTIGGHTRTHINLSQVRTQAEALGEIAQDRLNLEEMTGRGVRYFAYPFGASSNSHLNLVDLLKEAGYAAAVTTKGGFNSPDQDPFFLKRELADAAMPLSVFKARVNGNYDGVQLLRSIMNRRPPSDSSAPGLRPMKR